MQLRKLIRLLKEAEAKHGDRIEVCLDRRFVATQPKDYTFISISDVEAHDCVWNMETSENENWRTVLVLGNL